MDGWIRSVSREIDRYTERQTDRDRQTDSGCLWLFWWIALSSMHGKQPPCLFGLLSWKLPPPARAMLQVVVHLCREPWRSYQARKFKNGWKQVGGLDFSHHWFPCASGDLDHRHIGSDRGPTAPLLFTSRISVAKESL